MFVAGSAIGRHVDYRRVKLTKRIRAWEGDWDGGEKTSNQIRHVLRHATQLAPRFDRVNNKSGRIGDMFMLMLSILYYVRTTYLIWDCQGLLRSTLRSLRYR